MTIGGFDGWLDRLAVFLQPGLTGGFLESRGVDLAHDAVQVDRRLVALESPGELDFRVQFAQRVERPDFLAIVRGEKLWGNSPEVSSQIVHVADQHPLSVMVARRVDCPGQIDDHRPVVPEQDVEFGKVAVHDACAQHPNDFAEQMAMQLDGHLRRELRIVQARGALPSPSVTRSINNTPAWKL